MKVRHIQRKSTLVAELSKDILVDTPIVKWVYAIFGWFQRIVGNLLPRSVHFFLSHLFAIVFEHPVSRLIIRPYSWYHYKDRTYLNQFVPASGKAFYASFQDFFTRRLKNKALPTAPFVWPCEGMLCEFGKVTPQMSSIVKGDRRFIDVIFDEAADSIPMGYFFSNIFLHNKNYHRVHAPVNGSIESIKHIPGKLFFLRPYWNARHPSFPAMFNERVNIKFRDEQNRPWFLSIVGGPGVATIRLNFATKVGEQVKTGQEIAQFELGSTCCLAVPESTSTTVGSEIRVNQSMK